jgi:hypothetical protein
VAVGVALGVGVGPHGPLNATVSIPIISELAPLGPALVTK